ncbi:MAG TPA: nucleotidyltransferase family protein [Pseudomonadales bacterium]|nr:nucleotidyltransferase family protein [Pseudomonadales bacterium]
MNNKSLQIDAILLAAGSSSRFGSDKRLLLIDGVPMLQRALASIIDTVHSVTIVIKQDDRDILPQLLGKFITDTRVCPLLLEFPGAGMGSNLAQAVSRLSEKSDGVLVMLADMPYVQSNTVSAVVNAGKADRVVVPVFIDSASKENRGHPVLFSRRFFSELALLSGDSGARSLLEHHAQSVIFLPVPDSGILRDIDFFTEH